MSGNNRLFVDTWLLRPFISLFSYILVCRFCWCGFCRGWQLTNRDRASLLKLCHRLVRHLSHLFLCHLCFALLLQSSKRSLSAPFSSLFAPAASAALRFSAAAAPIFSWLLSLPLPACAFQQQSILPISVLLLRLPPCLPLCRFLLLSLLHCLLLISLLPSVAKSGPALDPQDGLRSFMDGPHKWHRGRLIKGHNVL